MQQKRKSPTPVVESAIRPNFRPDIEGIRGIAVILVVLFHAEVPYFYGGYIGVDVFFVLSGYLITWLLLLEHGERGGISLVGFYARRIGRLLPALIAVIVATLIAGLFIYAPDELVRLVKTSFATIFYGSNIYFMLDQLNYMSPAAETNPLLHSWSLAVEEQFYFIWPLVIMVGLGLLGPEMFGRKRRYRLMFAIVLVSAVSFALCVALMEDWRTFAFYSSPTRAWEFAAGALALLIGRGSAGQLKADRLQSPPASPEWLGWAGLAALLLVSMLYDQTTDFPGLLAVFPVLATCFLLRSGAAEGDSRLKSLLASKPLRYFGRLSYSWYLWHWPVLVFAAEILGELTLVERLLALGLSLILAELSFRLVETPGRKVKWFGARPFSPIAFGGMISVTAAGFCAMILVYAQDALRQPEISRIAAAKERLPAIYDTDCRPTFETSEVKECVYGDLGGDRTVVVFGDSHALHWTPVIEEIAHRQNWRVHVIAKSACPSIALDAFWYERMKRLYDECPEWREKAFSVIRSLNPDLVISVSSYGYDAGGIKAEEWSEGAHESFARLSAGARKTLHFQNTPRPVFDAPACALRAWGDADECKFPRARSPIHSAYARAERAAASRHGNVTAVDPFAWFCNQDPCPVEMNEVFLYRDGHHLTVDGALSVTDRLSRILVPAVDGAL